MKKIKFPKNIWARIGIGFAIVALSSPLWLGPLAKCIANMVVPGIVGVEFEIGSLWINPLTGYLSVGDMRMGNPEGYDERDSVNLQSLTVDVSMLSLLTGSVRVEDIDLDGMSVYISVDGGNFAKIGENASGGKVEAEEPPKASEPEPEKAEKEEGGNVEIDRLHIANLSLKYGVATIPVPELTLTDLGKSDGGASFAETWEQIKTAVLSSAGAIGGKFSELGKNAANAAGDAIGSAANAAGDAIGSAANAAGDAIGSAASAAGNGIKNATGAIKGLFK